MASKKGRVTIHDLARELNITPSTVSRALADHPRISASTKKAVIKLARKLNYQPNSIASSLRTGKGNTIGVIIPRISRHFFSTVIGGIEEVANQAGYNVLICQSHESYEKEVENVKALVNGRVDGLLVSIATETNDYRHFKMAKDRGIPLIFFDRVFSELGVSRVVLDDEEGAYQATKHLIEQGCNRIAHLAGPEHINVYYNRRAGYMKAMEEAGLKIREEYYITECLTRKSGYEAGEHLSALKTPPDGIFAAGDYSCLGAMLNFKEKGFRIPEDIAFVGFANEPFTSVMEPQLTTVEQHSLQMGRYVANLFLEEIRNKEEKFIPRTLTIKPELIIRSSSLHKK